MRLSSACPASEAAALLLSSVRPASEAAATAARADQEPEVLRWVTRDAAANEAPCAGGAPFGSGEAVASGAVSRWDEPLGKDAVVDALPLAGAVYPMCELALQIRAAAKIVVSRTVNHIEKQLVAVSA